MTMKRIMFTKHLEGKNLSEVLSSIQSAGFEGADLCVRPGYPVNLENAARALPLAARQFEKEGLAIPLVTAPGDMNDPKIKEVETLYGACAEAGVKLIKIGYWHMEEGDYWATVDRCRKKLEGFAGLSARFGVKTCIHNHSWSTMSLNSCATMNLVRGFDPGQVGIFSDCGHLAMTGEPLPMALSIVKGYLSAFAFKDTLRERTVKDGHRAWQMRIVPLGEGYVDFPLLLKLLKEAGFDGPVSFHCEYAELSADGVIDQARMDARFIRKLQSEIAP